MKSIILSGERGNESYEKLTESREEIGTCEYLTKNMCVYGRTFVFCELMFDKIAYRVILVRLSA